MAEAKKARMFDSNQIAFERAERALYEEGIRLGVYALKDILRARSRHDPERLRFFPCVDSYRGQKKHLKIVYFEPDGSDFDALVVKAAKKYALENTKIMVLNTADIKMPDEMED